MTVWVEIAFITDLSYHQGAYKKQGESATLWPHTILARTHERLPPMARFDVFGVGNALVDIQAQVEDSLLKDLAIDKGIMTLVDDARQEGVLGKLAGRPLHRCAGGSAANTIVAVADFGGTAAFVGKVGKDEVGKFFLQDMRDLGVTIDVEPADAPTGTCAVLITGDAQRTMLTNLGASATLTADDMDETLIKDATYVYVEGYLLTGETTKAAAYRAMELAKKHGTKIAFTASDPFLVNMIRDEIWDLITGPVDLFFCNEEEAKSLTGESDPIRCASKIHEHAENVALTLGEKGSLVMHGGEAFPIEGACVKAIDTTGAGDMYAGALLYGITNGMSWRQAGHLASQAAARVVSQLGARLDRKFTKAEVSEFLKM
jgi:sugar/nucleoside kinase (ribokinase family)